MCENNIVRKTLMLKELSKCEQHDCNYRAVYCFNCVYNIREKTKKEEYRSGIVVGIFATICVGAAIAAILGFLFSL